MNEVRTIGGLSAKCRFGVVLARSDQPFTTANVTAQLLLRIVAIIALLQFAGHGALFVLAKPTHGPDEIAVVDAMRKHAFRFAAAPRTYWDMYFGYGLEAAFVCLLEAVLFWLLAGASAESVSLVRSVIVVFAVWNVAHFVMLARYFAFPLPMIFDSAIAIGLVAAGLLLK